MSQSLMKQPSAYLPLAMPLAPRPALRVLALQAVAVIALVIEAIQNTVSGVIATPPPSARSPNAPW